MTDIERRALLGDRQAQEECTRLGIVLPCPFCGCDERDMLGMSVYHDQYFYCCESCGCNGPIVYVNDNCDHLGHEALALWNTRPAPPIGRCEDCGNTCPGSDGSYIICTIHGHGVEDDGFCDDFKPKGGDKNAM